MLTTFNDCIQYITSMFNRPKQPYNNHAWPKQPRVIDILFVLYASQVSRILHDHLKKTDAQITKNPDLIVHII